MFDFGPEMGFLFFTTFLEKNAVCGLRKCVLQSVTQIPEKTPVAAEPALVFEGKSDAKLGQVSYFLVFFYKVINYANRMLRYASSNAYSSVLGFETP